MDPSPNEDGILTPDDLSLPDDGVEQIGDNRYVVSTDPESDLDINPTEVDPYTRSTVESLRASEADFGITGAIKIDNTIVPVSELHQSAVGFFDAFVRRFAAEIDEDIPPEDILQLLIEDSSFSLSVDVVGDSGE